VYDKIVIEKLEKDNVDINEMFTTVVKMV